MQWSDCEKRIETLADYVISTGATVRNAAQHFGISKSTVHKDLTQKLPKISKSLYLEVKEVLELNKSERHIRGGEATKNKYLKMKHRQGSIILESRSFKKSSSKQS